MSESPQRILLVCCPGGHLLQLHALEEAWRDLDRCWVTVPAIEAEYLLAGEQVVYGFGPTTRSLKYLVMNLGLAWKTIRRYRPDVILSTGAGLAVPFFIVGRLLGIRLVYVESLTRVRHLGLSGRMVRPLTDAFFVQWPTTDPRGTIYAGSVV